MSHLRLVPRPQEPAGCVQCAQGCLRDGLFGFCACECHLSVYSAGGTLTQAVLERAWCRLSGQPLVRLT